jgi:hypothetical protein
LRLWSKPRTLLLDALSPSAHPPDRTNSAGGTGTRSVWSVAGDLAAVDVQDLTGNELR